MPIIIVSEKLVIPYGSASIPSDVLRRLNVAEVQDLGRPGAPVAVIDPALGQPLRLHSIMHPFTLPPVAQDLAHAETQLAFLERHLVRLCGEWAKSRRLLISRYFDALRQIVRAHESELNQRAKALIGLVELDHWCFSGLMPLPQAYLPCPRSDATANWQQSDFVSVDAAFWDRERDCGCCCRRWCDTYRTAQAWLRAAAPIRSAAD